MVSLQAVGCPYCHGTSYFVSGSESGYCTNCGRIIYVMSTEPNTVESMGDDGTEIKTHDLTIRYVKCGISHSRTMMVVVTGPERKEFAVNLGESMKVTLPEGEYQVIGTVQSAVVSIPPISSAARRSISVGTSASKRRRAGYSMNA